MSQAYDYDIEDCVLGAIMRNVDEYDNVAKYFVNVEVF